MTGKDLVNYILNNKLEDAVVDTGISDPLQFVISIPSDGVSGERELVYDFTRDFVYEDYLSPRPISYEESFQLRNLDILKGE